MVDHPAPESAEALRAQLREKYTEIATLAGSLAHEIKNPLSTIRLNMELLAEDFAAASTPRDRRALAKIDMVQRECQRLENLLNDFLKFAKVRPARRVPSDLNAEIERVLDLFLPQAADHGIEVVRYLDPDLPAVPLDREAFHGAMVNLVLNAQQAMPLGGQLVVRTHPVPEGVAIDLIDSGIGMDEKTLSQVFQAFYSTKKGGSGLGLPTTRKIIAAHGGRIDVQSAPGRGTQFTLILPVEGADDLATDDLDDRGSPGDGRTFGPR